MGVKDHVAVDLDHVHTCHTGLYLGDQYASSTQTSQMDSFYTNRDLFVFEAMALYCQIQK